MIRLFEEYNSTLFLPIDNFWEYMDRTQDISRDDIQNIRNMMSEISLFGISISVNTERDERYRKVLSLDITLRNKKPYTNCIDIISIDDEYYLLRFTTPRVDGDYPHDFKCDQIDGLIQCIKFIISNRLYFEL